MISCVRALRSRAYVRFFLVFRWRGRGCVRACARAHVCVCVLQRDNNNAAFGCKRLPVGGVPNKRHSYSHKNTEKKTQTNMLWEQSICISVRAHHQHARGYFILWLCLWARRELARTCPLPNSAYFALRKSHHIGIKNYLGVFLKTSR